MAEQIGLDELKARGAGRVAPAPVATLYHEAFRDFGVAALWDRRPSTHPTIAQVVAVAERLRREGTLRALPLAARIETACRAAV